MRREPWRARDGAALNPPIEEPRYGVFRMQASCSKPPLQFSFSSFRRVSLNARLDI